ncbi:MAG: methyltransferase, partial [Oscillospiraceae bacterium]|nr:methyltransferase [Oscillospiraceae bacterium]
MVAKFDPKELEMKESVVFGTPIKLPSYPLNQHDAFKALQNGEPWWMLYQASDTTVFNPDIIPDVIARAFVFEASMPKYFHLEMKGGKDMFGIDWEYVEQVGGSMVRPGIPFMEDADEWYDKVVWPDVDSWDWEGCAARNRGGYLQETNFNQLWFFSGYFERLIAMMEFENALMATFDEDYQEDVTAFFTKLTDLYIDIFDHIFKYFPEVNAVFFHDDWGSQQETFFSPALV